MLSEILYSIGWIATAIIIGILSGQIASCHTSENKKSAVINLALFLAGLTIGCLFTL